MEHKQIEIEKIIQDKNQPRKTFDQEEIKNLAKSIIKHGLLQNIVVRKSGENYTIVAGERRLRACAIAGIKKINCNIIKEEQYQELALIENIQRIALNPIEEAKAIKNLMKLRNYTQEQIAQKLGKNRSYISNKLRLLTLQTSAQEALQNYLTESHAKIILSIKSKNHQKRLLEEIKTNNLTVKQTKERAETLAKAQKTKTKIPDIKPKNQEQQTKNKKQEPKNPEKDKYLEKALENLENQLNRKITINQTKNQLKLEYYSQEDLEDLIEKLTQK